MKPAFILLAATLLLTACVSREQADERLARACAAAIELFLDEGFKIENITEKTFGDSREGNNFRLVTLNYVESDGWANIDKQGSCVFAEEFTPFNTSHNANLYQVTVNDQTFGKQGDKILGSYEDLLKLTETVDKAMGLF